MGRFWLGVCLLAVFLGLGLWVGHAMESTHEAVAQTLDEATQQTLSGDLEKGKTLAQQAFADWERNWHGVASVADHEPMDEIDGLFAQLEVYGETGQSEDFAAYCARLSKLVTAVGEAHGLSWWNLL